MIEERRKEFSALLISNKNIVWSVCNRYLDDELDREDLFQEVALSAWRSFPSFRNECKFSTWLYHVALCKALEKIRRMSARIKTTALDNILFEIVDSSQRTDGIELRDLYSHSLSQLSDSEMKFVILYAEGHSYDEMEIIMGVRQNNLRVRMNRIKQRLNKYNK